MFPPEFWRPYEKGFCVIYLTSKMLHITLHEKDIFKRSGRKHPLCYRWHRSAGNKPLPEPTKPFHIVIDWESGLDGCQRIKEMTYEPVLSQERNPLTGLHHPNIFVPPQLPSHKWISRPLSHSVCQETELICCSSNIWQTNILSCLQSFQSLQYFMSRTQYRFCDRFWHICSQFQRTVKHSVFIA